MKDILDVKVIFDKEYFKELLKEKKLTQTLLAKKCGLDMHTVSFLKIGRIKNPNTATVYKIAMVLDCQMEDLMKEI